MRTLVTGATGTLGEALRPRLVAAGHDVRAASRSPPSDTGEVEWIELDLTENESTERAVEAVDVVIHAATAPKGDTVAVDVEGTRRLLDAAEAAGVQNFVYPSIVGIDEIPFSYYRRKRAAEEAVEASDVPETVVRATQFHAFVDEILGLVERLPAWPLPTAFRSQPVDARDVAEAIVEYATVDASGRTEPVGGPRVCTLGELARTYRRVRGLRRPVFRLPLPGRTASAFRAGAATCPDHTVGTVTWEAWVERRYGNETNSRDESATLAP